MLDLRRLRLLHELHERGTIAAVADALRFTPSAVSQQLAALEREAGVPLLERSGRGVRLTDPALVLVEHAAELLDRMAVAEADLAAAAQTIAGRARIAGFQSVTIRLALPAIGALARTAPRLRCEVVEAEPEDAVPALALGEVDLVLADEWEHHPWRMPEGVERQEILRDEIRVVLPAGHPALPADPDAGVPLRALAGVPWTVGHPGSAWEAMLRRTCRSVGGFEPDIRHRSNDAAISLAVVASGLAATLLPDLALPDLPDPRIATRSIAERRGERAIFVVTRRADAARPSTVAVVAALREAADATRRD